MGCNGWRRRAAVGGCSVADAMRRRARLAVVILCALGAAAGAQEIKPDQPEVRPRPPSEPIKPTRTAPGGVAPSGLREDSIPGLEDADFRIGRPMLRAEGTL